MKIRGTFFAALVFFASVAFGHSFEGKKKNPEDSSNKKESTMPLPWYMKNMYTAKPALNTALIDSKVVVTEVLSKKLLEQGLQVGMEITDINGMNVIMYADKNIKPYTSYTSKEEMIKNVYSANLLTGYVNDVVILKMSDGKRFEVIRYYADEIEKMNTGETKIVIEKVE